MEKRLHVTTVESRNPDKPIAIKITNTEETEGTTLDFSDVKSLVTFLKDVAKTKPLLLSTKVRHLTNLAARLG